MSESNPSPVAAAKSLNVLDAFFLYGESPTTMMHVAALLRFSPPPGAPADYVEQLVAGIRRDAVVQDPWNRKLRAPRVTPYPLQAWVVDEDIDLDYHFRHSALGSPGGERELGDLVSRLHSTPLDLNRPPWEMHVIEGLADGGFAIYAKLHHSHVDGYSALQLLLRSLLPDPDALDTPIMFAVPAEIPGVSDGGADGAEPAESGATDEDGAHAGLLSRVADTVTLPVRAVAETAGRIGAVAEQLGSMAGQLGGAVGRIVRPADGMDRPSVALSAPDSIFNRKVGRHRRFSTQDLSLTEIKRVAKARGATVNDVCLAVLGGSLRRFLAELGELPDRSLISFVPISLRPPGATGGGNAVGGMLVALGTDIADPLDRLSAVVASARAGKAQFDGLSQDAAMALSFSMLGPAATQAVLSTAGVPTPVPPTFNVSVSNVPGPRETLYFRGSRLLGMYPVSIPYHSSLNVTFLGYCDQLDFGFIGDRDASPHLQRLAVYTGEALTELAAAVDAAAESAPAPEGATPA